ncbi:precorrin-2 C(20)-methyltransferase [Intestinibacillus massiliensis]|uniref:precorrin-2 C(20)-methyltransferase n=1 Tax=Intestinibacillus massiliensis TaxID=1871029 RepID=UPI000B35BB0E|nr:precorrin-2 C(20)-methyltransferase [Intestinibacillus massiliensis]
MKKGVLFGVGVGPGDPELITLKAVRILHEADVVAVPASGDGRKTALAIVESHVKDKPLLACATPMLRNKRKLAENYDMVAETLTRLLDEGKTVAFITLGDPSIYSTYMYIHHRVVARGYEAQLIPGVPSFCAVAARLNTSLCEGSELLHIIPSSHESTEAGLNLPGNKVLMKAGKSICAVRDRLAEDGKLDDAAMVECCGMENEKVYHTLRDLSDASSYFSVIVVKEGKE